MSYWRKQVLESSILLFPVFLSVASLVLLALFYCYGVVSFMIYVLFILARAGVERLHVVMKGASLLRYIQFIPIRGAKDDWGMLPGGDVNSSWQVHLQTQLGGSCDVTSLVRK